MMSENPQKTFYFTIFMWIVAVLGAGAVISAFVSIPVESLNLELLAIAFFTIAICSRIVVDIKIINLAVSVSDTFFYLVALLYGLEAAVILAALESYISSFQVSKKSRFHAFNAGGIAFSFFASGFLTEHFFGQINQAIEGIFTYQSVTRIASFIFLQCTINASMICIANSLRRGRSFIELMRDTYLWTTVACFASGSLAIGIAVAIERFGFPIIVVCLPILGVIYFSFQNHRAKLEAYEAQADQARKHLSEMQTSEERFRGAFGQAPIGMALVSPEGNWLQVNQALCKLLGYSETEFLEMNFRSSIDGADLVNFLSKLGAIIQKRAESFQMELRFFDKGLNAIWTSTSVSRISAQNENSAQLIFQIQDITERRNAEEKLRHAAFYDSLTNLANRTFFIQSISESIARANGRNNYTFAVAFMDIDRFKAINDSFGHTTGDDLLIAVAERLRNFLSRNHVIARLSGDEFTILFDGKKDPKEIGELVEKIQNHISSNYKIRGHSFYVSVSIGIAIHNSGYQKPEEMLRDADTALHEAKMRGRSRFLIFDEAMHSQMLRQLQLETDLRGALERNELFVVYQPIISLRDNQLNGFEALLRWNHPERGMVSPDEFIPLAEETGDIEPLGKFVLAESCAQMRKWQNESELPLTMCVNVSAKQFAQQKLFENVLNVLADTQLKASQVKLEITESVIVDNIENASVMLKQLRALGIQLSIDDFGTGYSSMSHLHSLPITTLKIDRAFVSQMESKKESAAIVNTIILLAKNLDLDVVAEGIETQAQLDRLRAFDCDYGQGFLFAKPLSAEEAGKLVENLRQSRDLAIIKYANRIDSTPTQIQTEILQ